MAKVGKKLMRYGAASLTLIYLRVSQCLPIVFSYAFMSALGKLAYYVVPRLRKVGMQNLDLAYGDQLTECEKKRILRGAIGNVADIAAEFARMPIYAKTQFKGRVTIKGQENVDLERGCLCVGGHFGNWEWMGPAMASCGFRVAEVVRPLDAPRLNTRVDALRCGGGITTIPKDSAGREIIRLIKEGWIVGLLVDQSPRINAVPVTFFDQPCWSTIGAAMIAARTRAPVHLVSMLRSARGQYTLEFSPALPLTHTANLRDDLVRNTQICQDAFEALVRKNPEQWLWLHRRWKRRERLEQEWEARRQAADEPKQVKA